MQGAPTSRKSGSNAPHRPSFVLDRRNAMGASNAGRLLVTGLLCSVAFGVASPTVAAGGGPSPVAIAVPDLVYVDTSGEPRDQTQEHAARIRRFSDALRGDLERN